MGRHSNAQGASDLKTRPDLEARLQAAHATNDQAELVMHYSKAADLACEDKAFDEAAFFLTHAWIFALESGHEMSERLADRLRAMGKLK